MPNEINVKTCEATNALASAECDLHQFAAKDNIEVSIDWFELLQKQVYPDDRGVRYYFVAEKNIPSTILPLRLTNNGGVRTVESLGNYYTSLYAPLLTNDSNLHVLRYMLASASRDHDSAHVMRFAPMDPESDVYKGLLSELRTIGWIPFKFFCFGNWFLTVDFTWEGYLKKRSANLRSSVKRRNKDFAAEGGTLEVVSNADKVEQAIADFQEVYTASWKIPEPYPDFVPSLIRRLSTIGMLRLGIARLQGKPIAAQLWIVGQGKASIYKVAYNKAFASLSPGTVLTSHLLKYVIEQDQVKEVDFLIGDDEYKKIWMSDRRERWGIVAYNPRTIIGFALLIKEVAGRVAKILRKKIKEIFLRSQQLGGSTNWISRLKIFAATTQHQRDQKMSWTIRPIAQFSEFRKEWDALVQSRPGTPFLESAFLLPLLDVFGTGEEQLCLLHSDSQLCAAAIMQRRQKSIWQTFQPSQLPLGAWVTNGNVDLVSACNELLRRLPGLTLGIGASQLDPRIQIRPEDSAKVRTQDYIQTAWIDIGGSFETYWEARGKNLKQNTRKQRNKLQAEGIETRIECITTPEGVKKAIEDYGSLESAGWKAADGTAILPDNAQGHFYRKMLENFCSMGRGRIYRYWFDDKVVAMDLCIHDHTAIVILKTAYDESYKAVSPSTLMRQDEFQQLFDEQKFSRIEFYGKVMEWHTRWTTQSRTLYHATEYRWAWLKKLHARMSAPVEQPSQELPSPVKT
ncbi:MAG: GNAT family N-acetyltransferase [Azonexus sp.]|nr:GNAT family N-acetyltransferase [Azonexus sp.]